MKLAVHALLFSFASLVAGCAIFSPVTLNTGETEPQVVAKLGQPTHRYQVGQDHLLEYATGPWGQKTYMARFGPDGKLISYEQVLTTQKFATIKVGESTKEDVLHTLGTPGETSYLSLPKLEVWSYSYKEANAWDSMMHVHFDKDGIVRKMMNGPDPKYDPDLHFPFGFMR